MKRERTPSLSPSQTLPLAKQVLKVEQRKRALKLGGLGIGALLTLCLISLLVLTRPMSGLIPGKNLETRPTISHQVVQKDSLEREILPHQSLGQKSRKSEIGNQKSEVDRFPISDSAREDEYLASSGLGSACYKEGRLDKAILEYKKALLIKKDSPEVHNNLGVAYHGKGDIDQAVKEFRQALKINPAYPEAHFNLAVALEKKGETVAAYQHYQKFAKLAPLGYQSLVRKVKEHIQFR